MADRCSHAIWFKTEIGHAGAGVEWRIVDPTVELL